MDSSCTLFDLCSRQQMSNRSNSSTASWWRDFPQLVMANCMRTLLPLILAISAVSASDQLLLNVDCGTTGTAKGYLGLTWVGDEQYVPSGQSARVRFSFPKVTPPVSTLRYFPSGNKNCYSFPDVGRGNKIMVRAWFFYGNYDGLLLPPRFAVFLNGNFWQFVALDYVTDFQKIEAIYITKADDVSLCLCRINGFGSPLINAFEIRKLEQSMYSSMDIDRPLYTRNRFAYGSPKLIRYPDDKYDRLWVNATYTNGKFSLAPPTGMPDPAINMALDRPPAAAVRQGITTGSSFPNMTMHLFVLPGSAGFYYVTIYFAEVSANGTRSFDLLLDNDKFYNQTIDVPRGSVREIFHPNVTLSANSTFSLVRASGSALPPLINAAECYAIGEKWLDLRTEASDVKALNELQKSYIQLRESNGDPCFPIAYNWPWLECSDGPNPRVVALYLGSYGLTGPLADFSNLTALETIDLHNNSLNGSVPEFLGQLPNLKHLNLANNHFSGSLPASLITSDSILNLTISGNNISSSNSSTGKKANIGVVAGGIIGSSSLILLLLVMFAIFIFKKRSGNAIAAKPKLVLEPETHCFSYAEIVEITKNFERSLGEGGSGKVYHGQLKKGDEVSEVAVKVLKNSLSEGTNEFVAEARLLMTVHHRCLVSFVGYCEEGGNLILLYEYMSGGNLRQLLSGMSQASSVLAWESRLKIALRVATGLDYLHSGCNPSIIHRDVKTTNILLNSRMEAKVADFGLSRAGKKMEAKVADGLSKAGKKDDGTHPSTVVANRPRYSYDQSDDTTKCLATTLAGTPGYMDPESYTTVQVTKKSDVYSFGVVLFELITGRPPFFVESYERIHIVEWVTPKIAKGEIHSIADPNLSGQYNVNSMRKAADIAVSCTSETSETRPRMIEVVNQLKEALDEEANNEQRTGNPSAEVQRSSSFYEYPSSSLTSSYLPPVSAR